MFEYVALFSIFGLCSYFYFLFRFNPYRQFMVVVAGSFAYVVWGTVHHLIRVRLYWHVIYEYILLAVLVVILFGFSLDIL